jgi:excisionase family DNA binding protein
MSVAHSPGGAETRAELLCIASAARCLGVSRRFIYTLLARGELRAVRLGRRTTRVARAEIDALVERSTHPRQD